MAYFSIFIFGFLGEIISQYITCGHFKTAEYLQKSDVPLKVTLQP